MANTTFSGPVTSTNGFVGTIVVPTYTVANAPSASDAGAGAVIYIFLVVHPLMVLPVLLSLRSLTVLTGNVQILAVLLLHPKGVRYV
jgi:hypothetical protein